jgi:hypothetical protein|tara:strand:+ start:199 stop:990 length:792 start_codon:yes stop_codon:yes gene_type:complete
MKGWISLHRKILDNPILSRGRTYSRFEAFVYMLLQANHKDNKAVIGNQIIKVRSGSFVTSQKKLMKEFRWGSTKLRAFIKMLEDDKMIVSKSNTYSTMITITNYDSYQNLQTTNKLQSESNQKTNKLQSKTNNNDNTLNNDNNDNKEQKFIDLVLAEGLKFTPIVAPDLIDDFCNYWTERNLNGTKMKYEMQKTFDIKRRLQRWIKNQEEWKPITKYKNEDFKFDATGYNRIGYCSKCDKSDFYKYPATEDSRCCGDKLKPRK